jgi:uncharacterized membrane protein YesL
MRQGAFREWYRLVMDYVLLNLIFLVFVLLGAGVTFGAAFKSLHFVAFKLADKDRHTAVFRDFWNGFKDEFLKSTLIWIAVAATGLLLFFIGHLALENQQVYLMVSVLVTASILVLYLLYLYPVMAVFQSPSLRALFRNTFLLFARNPLTSLLMLGSLATVVVMFLIFEGTILVSIGLFAWMETMHLRRLFHPYLENFVQDANPVDEDD